MGLAEGDVAGDYVGTTPAADLVTAHQALIDNAVGDTGFRMVVVSRRHDNVWREAGVMTPILTASLVDRRIDTQRRRLAGEGE